MKTKHFLASLLLCNSRHTLNVAADTHSSSNRRTLNGSSGGVGLGSASLDRDILERVTYNDWKVIKVLDLNENCLKNIKEMQEVFYC